jgi:two-component system, OmpR family, sensor kinase
MENREVKLSSAALNLFDQEDTNGFYFAIWSRGGALLKASTNAPPQLATPSRLGADTRTHLNTRENYREAFHFTEMGDCVLSGRDITADLRAIRNFAWWLAGAGCTVLALGLGGGWRLVTRITRPLEEITAAASRISAGNLSEQISIAETDSEVGRLAGVLNSTFGRLESAFAQQKQFTADASHELRTPLSSLISEAQATLARPRSLGEYRETIEVCLDTAQQMRRLTESLLDLARLDAGQAPMDVSRVDLAERARMCVECVRPLAEERGVVIHCDLALAETLGSPEKLGQVITNLLTNAIYYNKLGGEIRVQTRTEQDAALVSVADSGQGIAVEDLPHIFKRFYRADKSRSQANGQSGLGLAICQAIMESHGGAIEVTSEVGVGSTFTVRLQANPESEQS